MSPLYLLYISPEQEEESNWGAESADLRNRLDKLLDL